MLTWPSAKKHRNVAVETVHLGPTHKANTHDTFRVKTMMNTQEKKKLLKLIGDGLEDLIRH